MNLTEILTQAVNSGASDIILTSGSPPNLRINGQILEMKSAALTPALVKELVYALLSSEQKEKFEKELELDFPCELNGISRFRVNLHQERGNLAAAFRPIPARIPSLPELGLPKAVEEFAQEPRGLVLVTGPTGHGKTTTQAVMIDLINSSQKKHVITIEDPIEYLHLNKKSLVEQREVGVDTKSFNTALRHVLRQNPDVILIGEMRDLESMATAITAAETGHLVISTLHTGDAVQAIDRMVDVFPAHQQTQIRVQLSFTLVGIISQQLIPKSDGQGRCAAVEIMKVNAGIRNLIRKSNSAEIYSMIEIGRKYGMQSMDNALVDLYNKDQITLEAAKDHAINLENLERMIKA